MNNKFIKIMVMVIALMTIIFISVLHFALQYKPEKKLTDISDKIVEETKEDRQKILEEQFKPLKEKAIYNYKDNPVLNKQLSNDPIKYLPDREEVAFTSNDYSPNNVFLVLDRSPVKIDKRSFNIKLDNKYFDYFNDNENHGISLPDIPDDERYENRIILNRINASIKIPHPSDIYITEMDKLIMYEFYDQINHNLKMRVTSYIPDTIETDKIFHDIPLIEFLNKVNVDELNNVISDWVLYNKPSHYFAINENSNSNIGLIKDLNNIYTIVELYNSNENKLIDLLSTFELFNSNGFRYINSPYRDKIYVDNINSVF